jgi:acetyl/propionyl-CoA carboxylase alpha subunit
MSDAVRSAMGEAAVKAARAVGYVGAGTIEFIADASDGLRPDRFWFMEMNTRLQVEHPVTEAIVRQDLVEWQLEVAMGAALPLRQDQITLHGHAIEARLYAEDPDRGFLPSIGKLERLRLDERNVRIDTGVREGDEVTVFYDPMIAKVIGWGETRDAAAATLAAALSHCEIAGVRTNAGFLVRALREQDFLAGDIDTAFIERHRAGLLPERSGVPAAILARAARFIVEDRMQARPGHDPWDAQDGFRLSGEARETIEFALDTGRAKVEIVHHRGGTASFFVEGTPVEIALHAAAMRRANGDIAVMLGGETYDIVLHDPFASAEAAGAAVSIVVAPMPGKVVQVLVVPGEKVARGAALAVLEAMKMEHTLSAPADALVEAVEVTQGDQVGEGTVIVRFAKAEDDKARP